MPTKPTGYHLQPPPPPFQGFDGLAFFAAHKLLGPPLRSQRRVTYKIDRYTGRTITRKVFGTIRHDLEHATYMDPLYVNCWRFKPETENATFEDLAYYIYESGTQVSKTKMFSRKSGVVTRICGIKTAQFARIAGVSPRWLIKFVSTDRDPYSRKALTRQERINLCRITDTINILVHKDNRLTFRDVNDNLRLRTEIKDSEWRLKPLNEIGFLLSIIRSLSCDNMVKWFANHSLELDLIHERMRIHYSNREPAPPPTSVADALRIAGRELQNEEVK